jgi:hypothetical protein
MKTFIAIAVTMFAIGFWTLPATAQGNVLPEKTLNVLLKAEKFELLSLNPEPEKVRPKDHFHGYTVLGKTEVKDAALRKDIVESFKKGMEGEINPAKCFDPRHGFRATHEGKTVELVICFACSQFYVHDGSGNSKYLVNMMPQTLLNKVLKDAGISIAK